MCISDSLLSFSPSLGSLRQFDNSRYPEFEVLQNATTSPIRNVAYCALAAPKAARDIDSYALFGHGGVHTRAYRHVSGICIRDYTSRVDRIAVRAAGSESSRTYIFMYLSRTPFVFTCRPIAANNFSASFLRSKLRSETFAAHPPRDRLSIEFRCVYFRHEPDTYYLSVTRDIYTRPVFFARGT